MWMLKQMCRKQDMTDGSFRGLKWDSADDNASIVTIGRRGGRGKPIQSGIFL
jgi:hypothetical protein